MEIFAFLFNFVFGVEVASAATCSNLVGLPAKVIETLQDVTKVEPTYRGGLTVEDHQEVVDPIRRKLLPHLKEVEKPLVGVAIFQESRIKVTWFEAGVPPKNKLVDVDISNELKIYADHMKILGSRLGSTKLKRLEIRWSPPGSPEQTDHQDGEDGPDLIGSTTVHGIGLGIHRVTPSDHSLIGFMKRGFSVVFESGSHVGDRSDGIRHSIPPGERLVILSAFEREKF